MASTALIILGMHRSGTSAFTGSLKCLGVNLGDKLYAGHVDINAKGYWEHSDIADTHDDILRLLGSRWDDINPLPNDWEYNSVIKAHIQKLETIIERDFSHINIWGLKDPRMCRLLPIWNQIFNKKGITPFYIFISRHPLEVARSLEKRNAFTLDRGLFLWLDHNIRAEKFTRGYDRVFVTYDQLLTDPKAVFHKLEKTVEFPFPISVPDGWECIEKFIESDLRHHSALDLSSKNELQSISYELFGKLKDLSNKDFNESDKQELTVIYNKFDQYFSQLPEFLLQSISELNKDYAHILGVWREAFRSYSWQILKPARYLERLIKKLLMMP